MRWLPQPSLSAGEDTRTSAQAMAGYRNCERCTRWRPVSDFNVYKSRSGYEQIRASVINVNVTARSCATTSCQKLRSAARESSQTSRRPSAAARHCQKFSGFTPLLMIRTSGLRSSGPRSSRRVSTHARSGARSMERLLTSVPVPDVAAATIPSTWLQQFGASTGDGPGRGARSALAWMAFCGPGPGAILSRSEQSPSPPSIRSPLRWATLDCCQGSTHLRMMT
jgi:hypothetical protein